MNQVLRGTYGRVWINNDKLGQLQTFEAKVKGEYEDFDIAEKMGKERALVGYEGEGSIKFKKIDSKLAKTIAMSFKTGVLPDIKIIAELDDPGNTNVQRVEILGVTFDEAALLAFETKKTIDEEISFKFSDFNYL